MKPELSGQMFENNIQILKFYENPSSRSRVVPYGQTDRHDEVSRLFAILRTRLKMMQLFDADSCSLSNQSIIIFTAFVQPGTLLQCTLNA